MLSYTEYSGDLRERLCYYR